MTVYAGDRAPMSIRFSISTSAAGIDGTQVASVRLRVLKRDGSTVEWGPYAPSSATTSTVTVQHTLAAGGTDLPTHGKYAVSAWLYASGGALLGSTADAEFNVLQRKMTAPT